MLFSNARFKIIHAFSSRVAHCSFLICWTKNNKPEHNTAVQRKNNHLNKNPLIICNPNLSGNILSKYLRTSSQEHLIRIQKYPKDVGTGQNWTLNTQVFRLGNAPQQEVQEWPGCHLHVAEMHIQGCHCKCQIKIAQEGNCNFQ